MLSASAEVGMVASHDYISGYIVASDGYLVARFDSGDIFVLNRATNQRTMITGANVESQIALHDGELTFIRHKKDANDSVVYLDLTESGLGF